MNNTTEHQALVDDVMMELGSHPRIRIWPRRVGVATNDNGNVTRYGIKGESDLQGILAPYGKMIAIEIKTGVGRLSKSQKIWREMIIKFGGLYCECRSIDDAIRFRNEILQHG